MLELRREVDGRLAGGWREVGGRLAGLLWRRGPWTDIQDRSFQLLTAITISHYSLLITHHCSHDALGQRPGEFSQTCALKVVRVRSLLSETRC